ncbi:hypothetical protein DFH06DRAFT_1126329 [Mycena polygramma]|nr:hypothetical protein DFH06DRAFT_1126329 [Mycena polygramma]
MAGYGCSNFTLTVYWEKTSTAVFEPTTQDRSFGLELQPPPSPGTSLVHNYPLIYKMAPYVTDAGAYADAAKSLYDPASSPIASIVHQTTPDTPDTGLRQFAMYMFILLGALVLSFGYIVGKYYIRKWRSKAAVDDEGKSLPASSVEFRPSPSPSPPPPFRNVRQAGALPTATGVHRPGGYAFQLPEWQGIFRLNWTHSRGFLVSVIPSAWLLVTVPSPPPSPRGPDNPSWLLVPCFLNPPSFHSTLVSFTLVSIPLFWLPTLNPTINTRKTPQKPSQYFLSVPASPPLQEKPKTSETHQTHMKGGMERERPHAGYSRKLTRNCPSQRGLTTASVPTSCVFLLCHF